MNTKKPDPDDTPRQFVLQMDQEDRALLERLSAMEKLSKADIIRRALRLYAKDFGLLNQPAA